MILQVFVGERCFLVLVCTCKVVCIETHDLLETDSIILVHFQSFGIESVLLNVVLGFIEGLEFFEMSECFATSAKLVVDLELATNKWKILERLEVRKVFPGVL
jgi:hypothetical protein